MYKKIFLMIFFNFQFIDISIKMILILFVMFFMNILYANFNPYFNKKYNKLEQLSSLSAFTLVFSANLYILEVSVNIKAICFLVITITNVLFFIPWFLSVLRIIILKYRDFFMKYFPKIAILILTVYDLFRKIGFDLFKFRQQANASLLNAKKKLEKYKKKKVSFNRRNALNHF